jgi:hypothetical protein
MFWPLLPKAGTTPTNMVKATTVAQRVVLRFIFPPLIDDHSL